MWIFAIYETPGIRRRRLEKAGVKERQVIVDLGCGPGRFVFLASKIIGPEGKVYALDIHPLNIAIVTVRKAIGGYKNINVMYADCHATQLPARILKTDGILAIDEHEMREAKFMRIIESANLFTLIEKEKKLYKFKLLIGD